MRVGRSSGQYGQGGMHLRVVQLMQLGGGEMERMIAQKSVDVCQCYSSSGGLSERCCQLSYNFVSSRSGFGSMTTKIGLCGSCDCT